MSFGDSLKRGRKNAGYTQSELGEILGVGKTTIINWEKGKTSPQNKEMYDKITAALHIKKEEPFVTGSSEILLLFEKYLNDKTVSEENKARLFVDIQNLFIRYVSTS